MNKEVIMEDDLISYLNQEEKYTITELSKIWDMNYMVFVRKCNKKYKIKLMNWNNEPKTDIESELLSSLYWGNQYLQMEIAEIFGCDRRTIENLMKRFGIPARDLFERQRFIECKTRFKKGCHAWNKDSNPNLLFEKKVRNFVNADFKWYKQVFERDNYTCQSCGERGNKLNAHHITSIKQLVNDFVKCYGEDIEKIKKYKLILSLDNGITLCEKCHRNLHRKKE